MWRTEKGRRYRTFPSLAEANYFASEMQRERAVPSPPGLWLHRPALWAGY